MSDTEPDPTRPSARHDEPALPTTHVEALRADARLCEVLQPVGDWSSASSPASARPILHPRVQKNGLVLAGHFHGLVPTRVQVFGETEISFLASLSPTQQRSALERLFAQGLSMVLVTGVPGPDESAPPRHDVWAPLMAAAEASATPLFFANLRSSQTINLVHAALDDLLAPHTELHGVLVDVYGVGVLLRGQGGIGKSECALELVRKGHRLVADDVVYCAYRPPGVLYGSPVPLLRHHMEIRGLGILNIRDLFGVTSVRHRKRIDVVVRLVEWKRDEEYDRLGVDDSHENLLGVPLRALTVPVKPGRDMGTIVEIAARDELLRRAGVFSARSFISRIEGSRAHDGGAAPSAPDAAHAHLERSLPRRPSVLPDAPESSVELSELPPRQGAPSSGGLP